MSLSLNYTLEDFDEKKIISKFGMEDGGPTEMFFSNTCAIRMQKYVPFKSGTLSTTFTVEPKKVTYEMPYAHKQYTENKGKDNRGSYWDRRMVSAEKGKLAKEVEAYARKLKGNK